MDRAGAASDGPVLRPKAAPERVRSARVADAKIVVRVRIERTAVTEDGLFTWHEDLNGTVARVWSAGVFPAMRSEDGRLGGAAIDWCVDLIDLALLRRVVEKVVDLASQFCLWIERGHV